MVRKIVLLGVRKKQVEMPAFFVPSLAGCGQAPFVCPTPRPPPGRGSVASLRKN